jgi:hypothetical protein
MKNKTHLKENSKVLYSGAIRDITPPPPYAH